MTGEKSKTGTPVNLASRLILLVGHLYSGSPIVVNSFSPKMADSWV